MPLIIEGLFYYLVLVLVYCYTLQIPLQHRAPMNGRGYEWRL